MLLNDFKMSTDIKSIPFSETQKELMQKFNLAFYEAQTKNIEHENILETFDERYFNEIENYENDIGDTNCIFDLLLSKIEPANPPTNTTETNFDYTDFCETFEKVRKEGNTKVRRGSVSTETVISTETSNYSEYGIYYEHFDSNQNDDGKCDVDALELSEIDLTESLSNSSLDLENFDEISYEFEQSYQPSFKLPPVETIHKSCLNFSNFIRNSNPVSLHFDDEVKHTNTYGHIIGQQSINNNTTENYILTQTNDDFIDNNQAVMTQSDALLYDDPLLSSSSLMIPKRERKNTTTSQDSEFSIEENDITYNQLQCKWEHCFQMFESQMALVKHIEKYHVELKRGEEFTCFWLDCPRKTKPFNARYKLLIHMRVHSLHKPNKCPFQGCHKAFSRLENLKIHQRSHTGERPYLCQFSNCTKSFSNSSDRAKHQRTHYDTKPYACQVSGCLKKYTDPSSLRKHVKNHTYEEQLQVKKKTQEVRQKEMNFGTCKKSTALASPKYSKQPSYGNFYTRDHSYSNNLSTTPCIISSNIKQDLKLRLSEKISKDRQLALN